MQLFTWEFVSCDARSSEFILDLFLVTRHLHIQVRIYYSLPLRLTTLPLPFRFIDRLHRPLHHLLMLNRLHRLHKRVLLQLVLPVLVVFGAEGVITGKDVARIVAAYAEN